MRLWRNNKRVCLSSTGDLRKDAPLSAFSLAELLVVLCIMGVLYGAVSLSVGSLLFGGPTPESVRKEAERTASWLQRIFYKALLYNRPFTLMKIPSNSSQRKLVVYWHTLNVKETYDSGGEAFFRDNRAQSQLCDYFPVWNMIVPGLTIRVVMAESGPGAKTDVCYIVVSPFTRVTVSDSPPAP